MQPTSGTGPTRKFRAIVPAALDQLVQLVIHGQKSSGSDVTWAGSIIDFKSLWHQFWHFNSGPFKSLFVFWKWGKLNQLPVFLSRTRHIPIQIYVDNINWQPPDNFMWRPLDNFMSRPPDNFSYIWPLIPIGFRRNWLNASIWNNVHKPVCERKVSMGCILALCCRKAFLQSRRSPRHDENYI